VSWRATGIGADALPLGSIRAIDLDAGSVLLIRLSDRIYAVEAVCPHLAGLLADGGLEGERLTCPEHAAVFDVRDGHVLADPFGIDPPEGGVGSLTTYPTRVEAGMVEVDLP
jgi:nitrite reductase/ring-hydroxylating ferredoxin subunit